MKLKYLGTGAFEGIPFLYCKCKACENARKKKGKELRTRSGLILDDKIAIDFSADSYSNLVKYDVDFAVIEHVLITHTHEDHFSPSDLVQRFVLRPEGVAEKLCIYGNASVKKKFFRLDAWCERIMDFVSLKTLKREEKVDIGGYKVTPFYVEHMREEDCYVYLIEKDGRAYLHLMDSSEPTEKLYDYLSENNVHLDAVTMDCTYGSLTTEYFGHMNIWQNIRVKNTLQKLGVANQDTKFVCTHFSHFSVNDTHETLCQIAAKNCLIIAYDGMDMEF